MFNADRAPGTGGKPFGATGASLDEALALGAEGRGHGRGSQFAMQGLSRSFQNWNSLCDQNWNSHLGRLVKSRTGRVAALGPVARTE